MKKIISLVAVAAIALGFASCEPKVDKTIDITISTLGTSKNVTFWNGTTKKFRYGFWDLQAEDTTYVVKLRNADKMNYVAGEYDVAKLDDENSYILKLTDSTKIHFTSGKITVIEDDGGDRVIAKGNVIGSDNNAYNLRIVFQAPYAFVTKEITAKNATVDESLESHGVFGVYGGTSDAKYYTQLYWQGDTITGTYYRCDLYDSFCGINELDESISLDASDIYSANLSVRVDTTKVYYTIVGSVLCYNNTLYKIDMKALRAPRP